MMPVPWFPEPKAGCSSDGNCETNLLGKLSELKRSDEFVGVSEKAKRFFRKGSAKQWRDHAVQVDCLKRHSAR